MQYIESSVIGIRSAIITLKRRTTPLRFILFPMVHVAEQAFYDGVAARARECDLIVAEGAPSGSAAVQERVSRIRWDHLVDQMTGLDLEGLGVPVQWEHAVQDRDRLRSNREQVAEKVIDSAAAVVLRALGRYGSPLGLPNLEQADEHDDQWDRQEAGRFGRFIDDRVLRDRDTRLVRVLGTLHRERYTESIKVAVVFGAGHIPAVVDYLGGDFRYYVEQAEWLTVAKAPA